VRPYHIDQIVRALGVRHPYRASRVRASCSALFNRAVHLLEKRESPVNKHVRRWPEPRRPDRYLSKVEAAALMGACEEHHDWRVAAAIKLLMFTGARRGETLAAKWSEFDLDAGVWIKPSAHTKNEDRSLLRARAGCPAAALQLQAAAPP
jgi:integrase